VYCGKTADWIWIPFGVVSGVGRGMGILDMGGDRRRGRGIFGGKCEASHCNRCRLCCVVILCREGWRRGSSKITSGYLVFNWLTEDVLFVAEREEISWIERENESFQPAAEQQIFPAGVYQYVGAAAARIRSSRQVRYSPINTRPRPLAAQAHRQRLSA